jgi:hypothetical protein
LIYSLGVDGERPSLIKNNGGKFKLTGPFTTDNQKGGEYDDFDDDEKTKVETTVVLLRLWRYWNA